MTTQEKAKQPLTSESIDPAGIEFNFAVIEQVEVGVYNAAFMGVSRREPNEYGTSIAFVFKVVGSQYDGLFVDRLCSIDRSPSAKNAAGKFVTALAGRVIQKGERINPAAYTGGMYRILVANSGANSEFTRVESILGPASDNAATSGENF